MHREQAKEERVVRRRIFGMDILRHGERHSIVSSWEVKKRQLDWTTGVEVYMGCDGRWNQKAAVSVKERLSSENRLEGTTCPNQFVFGNAKATLPSHPGLIVTLF